LPYEPNLTFAIVVFYIAHDCLWRSDEGIAPIPDNVETVRGGVPALGDPVILSVAAQFSVLTPCRCEPIGSMCARIVCKRGCWNRCNHHRSAGRMRRAFQIFDCVRWILVPLFGVCWSRLGRLSAHIAANMPTAARDRRHGRLLSYPRGGVRKPMNAAYG
jgi:hypothetical protein